MAKIAAAWQWRKRESVINNGGRMKYRYRERKESQAKAISMKEKSSINKWHNGMA
jgi:hypothetical protein